MELAKGVRDFPPEVQLIREDLFRKIRSAFERHGFAPFSTPIIHRKDTLTFKFTEDEDVMRELFTLQDQGERELGLRFDLTVPLCRYVAEKKDLKFPFKRYEIGRVYRDGPIKLGRYREFWQCDADIVGSPSMIADAECIKVACDVLTSLQYEYVVKVNSRKLLDAIMNHLDIKKKHEVIVSLDKLEKIGRDEVHKLLCEVIPKDKADKLLDIVIVEGSSNGKFKHIEQKIGDCDGLKELKILFTYLKGLMNVVFEPSLARGLNYYTGTIFEGFLIGSEITSSVCGGGRYDNIIGQMRGDSEIPAVGISFGIDPLTDALLKEKRRFDKTSTQVFVVPIKAEREAASIADRLRARGIRVDLDVMGRSISKNLDHASSMEITLFSSLVRKIWQTKSAL